jgi:DNA-binding response OmpR family regulator
MLEHRQRPPGIINAHLENVRSRILLVDDDPRNLHSLGHFLRSEGYDVNETCDGSEVAKMLENDAFDLVISDVIMPGVSGLQLLEYIRSIAPKTPVLFMSGFGSIHRTEMIERGAVDLITKPFDLNEVLSKVKQALLIS